MNILDYIKGNRKGKGANRLEKDAMSDPFLNEAIEGFENTTDHHIRTIESLNDRIKSKSITHRKKHPAWQFIAACVVGAIGLSTYLFIEWNRADLHAHGNVYSEIINIYTPDSFYTNNIVEISQTNAVFARSYTPNIRRFVIDENPENATVSDEERKGLDKDTKKETEIEIYIPDAYSESVVESSKDGKPMPTIGFEKYNTYLKKALQRPTDDVCKDRKGKVVVEFSVNENGQPYDLKIKYSLCGTSDKEAIRLIENGPKWTPGTEKAIVKVEF